MKDSEKEKTLFIIKGAFIMQNQEGRFFLIITLFKKIKENNKNK